MTEIYIDQYGRRQEIKRPSERPPEIDPETWMMDGKLEGIDIAARILAGRLQEFLQYNGDAEDKLHDSLREIAKEARKLRKERDDVCRWYGWIK